MGLSTSAAARIAAGALILLVHLPVASAQDPLSDFIDQSLNIAVVCERAMLEPPYAGVDESACYVQDMSRDALIVPGSAGGTSPQPHMVTFRSEPLDNASEGWQVVLSESVKYPVGGDRVPFTVRVAATPTINSQDYFFRVIVDYTGPNNHQTTKIVNFTAQVDLYDFALVSMNPTTIAQKAGQDEIVTYEVLVSNTGVYPDSYRFSIKSDADIRISTPPNLFVPPGETRSTNVSILTPKGKIYEIGRSTTVNIKVNSITGSGAYGTVGLLQIRGWHIPVYWIPLFAVGLLSASVVARGSREKQQLRTMERGRPRRVEITPRQTVLLNEMRRTDIATYKEKKAALDNVYKERREDYRAHRKERAAADRAEAKVARAEFAAAKKERKARRTEEIREAKRLAAEKRAADKIARKEQKKEAKLLKKKEKVLKKQRAKLEKKKAKVDARDAKIAAKQAKLDAKQAKREEKAAKKAEKAARKK